MGTYNIPRDVKGENKILLIFSMKSFIYFIIGALIGLPFYFLFYSMKMFVVGIIAVLIFAFIGFAIGTFKIPEIGSLKFTKKVGGENIDDVIKRAILFKRKGGKIYLYTKEEEK